MFLKQGILLLGAGKEIIEINKYIKKGKVDSIILFSRCELVDLYGSVSKYLSGKFNIIHLAYSNKEADTLKKKYKIKNILVFKKEIEKVINENKLNPDLIKEIDNLVINQSQGRFCLNSAIQSDRGFSNLSYNEALFLSQVYYMFWDDLISRYKIKMILHEPTSLFFNHIAALLCKKYSIHYFSQIMVQSDRRYSFIYIADDDANAIELNAEYNRLSKNEINENKVRINNFITKITNSENIYLSEVIKVRIGYIKIILSALKEKIYKTINPSQVNKYLDNIEFWKINSGEAKQRLINLIRYQLSLKYNKFDQALNYYYYPFHLEPEAVVLYWGDGIYKGQVKLIENIAAQLPPHTYLYVKDHPHYIGYRKVDDYLSLQKIPNIRLISPEIAGRTVIKHSLGVITINGTAGFEALMMKKQVYVFGNAFYSVSKAICKVKNIKDLREELYKNINKVFEDDQEINRMTLAFLNTVHEGVVDYFAHRIYSYPIDLEENSKKIADSLIILMSQKDNYSKVKL